MLFERLEEVRQQPKEVRRRFAFVWSLVITGIIVILWLSVIFGRSYALRDEEATAGEEELQTQDIRESFDESNDFRFDFDSVLPEAPTASSTGTSTEATSTEPQEVGVFSGSSTQNTIPSDESWQEEDPQAPPILPEFLP